MSTGERIRFNWGEVEWKVWMDAAALSAFLVGIPALVTYAGSTTGMFGSLSPVVGKLILGYCLLYAIIFAYLVRQLSLKAPRHTRPVKRVETSAQTAEPASPDPLNAPAGDSQISVPAAEVAAKVEPVAAQPAAVPTTTDARLEKLERELHHVQDGLYFQVTHDPLTGLWNRNGIINRLVQELARRDREHTHFGVILLGADHLKAINDIYGDKAGDTVLRGMTRRISQSVRPYDSIGRISGNEFLIVAPGCDLDRTLTLAERIRTLFAEEKADVTEEPSHDILQVPEERRISITLSLGVFASEELENPDHFLRAARAAFSRAKREGGNRVEAAEDSRVAQIDPSCTQVVSQPTA